MLLWQQSAIYSYERKWNLRCVPNLHCECQELKPKVETNTSFLVRDPFSGVDTVKTVGSHLNTCEEPVAESSKKSLVQNFVLEKVKYGEITSLFGIRLLCREIEE